MDLTATMPLADISHMTYAPRLSRTIQSDEHS